MHRYKLWLVNFGWYASESFTDLNDAIAYARRIQFESVMYLGEQRIGSYHPFRGFVRDNANKIPIN